MQALMRSCKPGTTWLETYGEVGTEKFIEVLNKYGVDKQFHRGLWNYLAHGLEPGGFLKSLIQNDLRETIARADSLKTILQTKPILNFFYNEVTQWAYGSPKHYENWVTNHHNARISPILNAIAE